MTLKSGRWITVVDSLSVLLSTISSWASLVTVTVLLMVLVSGMLALTFTTRRNVSVSPAGNVPMVAVSVPVPPTGGVEGANAGPEAPVNAVYDTKVVFAGIASEKVTF